MSRRSEFTLISEVFRRLTEGDPLAFGLSDDAALLRLSSGDDLVVTTDAMAEGVHFLAKMDAADVGRKLLRVNLSDLAAMGADPVAYTLTMVLPPSLEDSWIDKFAMGLLNDQRRYGLHLIGGDTIAAPHLVVSMTLFGRVQRDSELWRKGAQPGDSIFVSGTIGDAGLALKVSQGAYPELSIGAQKFLLDRLHRPSPRLELGKALQQLAHAAIDVSDGLIADLGHLCARSGVSAEVQLDAVPVSEAADEVIGADSAADLDRLAAGDDYELVFASPIKAREEVAKLSKILGVPITEIGKFSVGAGVHVLNEAGLEVVPPSSGFQHF